MTKAPLGEKVGKNPRTAKRSAPNAASSPTAVAYRSGWPDGANRHDFKLTRETIESIAVERLTPRQTPPKACVWTKAMIATRCGVARRIGFTAHIRARGEEAQALKQEAGFKARCGWWSARIVG